MDDQPRWYRPLTWFAAALIGGLAVLARINRHAELAPTLPLPQPFTRPWHRPPTHDTVAQLFGGDLGLAAVVIGVGGVAATAAVASLALPPAGRLSAAALAALVPAMVLCGAFWTPQGLLAIAVAWTAYLLHGVLGRHDRGSPRWLGVAVATLLLVDWPAWSPVLAWIGWLLVFRPAWLAPERARAALLALGAGSAAGLVGYGALLFHGAAPADLFGTADLPLGQEAALAVLDAISAPVLGHGRAFTPGARAAGALLVGAFVFMGWRRATRAGAGPWASVLVVGSAGALVPALAIHPVLPFAADKNLWFLSPLVLCLAVAAVWPIDRFEGVPPPTTSRARLTPVTTTLALVLVLASLGGCVDEDGDGVFAGADCDDLDASVFPGAPDLWLDGLDNDCDGAIDSSPSYVFATETEPNDTTVGSCFAPDGQDLGHLAPPGELTRITGHLDSIVEGYVDGDFDCFAFGVPDGVDHPRLRIVLDWEDDSADLDLALTGLWEGAQAGFAQGDSPGPGPEIAFSSSGFDPGARLWLWIAGYAWDDGVRGPPTPYTVDLVLQ